MNKLKIFQNIQFGSVRVAVNESNEPLFCLADVCQVIGIKDTSRCASRLDDDMRQTHPIQDTLGRTQQATFVTESGLYDVIIRSDSDKAKPFRKWVTGEVLPSIRKHGAYMTGETLAKMLQNPDNLIELLTALKSEQQRNATLSIQNEMNARNIEAMQPKAVYYDAVLQSNALIPTEIIAAQLGISAINLNKFLCEYKIQRKVDGVYVLCSDLRGKGYEGYKTYYYNDSNTGKVKTKRHMYWTEKGAEMIANLHAWDKLNN